MSHFTVLVIGNDPEKQLAPYHEFECTGDDNKYIQDVDETEEVRTAYNKDTVKRLKASDGSLHDPYDDKFYREPTEEEKEKNSSPFDSKVKFIPEGYEELEFPRSEVETFSKYVEEYYGRSVLKVGQTLDLKDEHKYGYCQLDENGEVIKVINRTNPDSKWDWYLLGGRWSGMFKLKNTNSTSNLTKENVAGLCDKYGVSSDYIYTLANFMKNDPNKIMDYQMKNPVAGGYDLSKELEAIVKNEYKDGIVGQTGTFGGMAKAGYVDQAKLADIDFAGIVADAENEARERFLKVQRLFSGKIPVLEHKWADIIDDSNKLYSHMDISEKREFYRNQAAKKVQSDLAESLPQKDEDRSFISWLELGDYECGIEKYVANAGAKSFSTFAVIKDGKWAERGEMGWFGCVKDEKNESAWDEEFMKLLTGLPKDTLLSLYDCHI